MLLKLYWAAMILIRFYFDLHYKYNVHQPNTFLALFCFFTFQVHLHLCKFYVCLLISLN